MAKEDEKKPTAAEKGKGKAVNGDAEKDKDTKADGENKKGAATSGGMFCPRNSCHGHHDGLVLTASYRGAQRGRPATQE